MLAEGHEIGSHTASHAAGASSSQGVGAFTKSGIAKEMTGVEEVLSAIGSPMQLSVSIASLLALALGIMVQGWYLKLGLL
jgi:hypothetical protein